MTVPSCLGLADSFLIKADCGQIITELRGGGSDNYNNASGTRVISALFVGLAP